MTRWLAPMVALLLWALPCAAQRPPAAASPGTPAGAVAPAATALNEQEILIFRPVETIHARVDPDALLEVPVGDSCLLDARGRHVVGCGFMYGFQVEVSAFAPIRWVTVNGRVVARPGTTWARATEWLPVSPAGTRVVVEAATAERKARAEFVVRIPGVRLPGTRFYLDLPPGETAAP